MTVAAGTLVPAFSVEDRNEQHFTRPNWMHRVKFSVVSGDTTAAATIPINGTLRHISYETPNTSNDNLTSEMAISDSTGNERFTTGAGIAESATPDYAVDEAFAKEIAIAITFNEDVGVSADFFVTLWGV